MNKEVIIQDIEEWMEDHIRINKLLQKQYLRFQEIRKEVTDDSD